jgi:cytochrome c oxidase assembly protein subunit 15
MTALRRLSIAALAVACLHLVFGAIVRISGSGMGCGDNWPKCYGHWFPPFNRPDLIVEVSHRYLASILVFTVCTLAFVAFRKRGEAGVSGPGGVLRSALGAVAAVFSAAILGGVTVKMGNAPWATVAHWLVAMTLLAMVATTAMRAGALGGTSARKQRGSSRAARSAFAAAGLAIFAVALGGLTAKVPGASVSCTTIPSCGRNPGVDVAAVMVQMTHRTAAVLLLLHLFAMAMMLRKRREEEATVVVRAAHLALAMVVLQLIVASSMILFHLPAVLRSLHEATGVGIWLSCFALAYLARRTAANGGSEAVLPEPAPVIDAAPEPRVSARIRPSTQPVAELRIAEAPPVVARPVAVAPVVAERVVAELMAVEAVEAVEAVVEPVVAVHVEPIVDAPPVGRRIVIEQANALVEYSIVEVVEVGTCAVVEPVVANLVETPPVVVAEPIVAESVVPAPVAAAPAVVESTPVEPGGGEALPPPAPVVTVGEVETSAGVEPIDAIVVETPRVVVAEPIVAELVVAAPVFAAPTVVETTPVEAVVVEAPPPAVTLASRKATMAVIVARGADL